MANPLDALIDQQNSPGIGMGGFQRLDERPATPAQISGVRDPNTPMVTVAPNSGVQIEGDFGASGLPAIQADWNRTPADIRRDLTLDILRTRAAQNKFALEEQQQRAPLQDRLLQAKIEATGAHQRFMEAQDTDVLNHTAGFLSHLSDPNAPNPDDPGYSQYVVQGLLKHPRFAETKGGQAILQNLVKSQGQNLSLSDALKQLPEGFTAEKVEAGGGKAAHVIGVRTSALQEKQFKSDWGVTPTQIKNAQRVMVGDYDPDKDAFKDSNTGKDVRITTRDGKTIVIPAAIYEKAGGKYSAETLKARGAGAGEAAGAAGVGDKKAQAQQILNDPDASEEARNAARSFMLKGK